MTPIDDMDDPTWNDIFDREKEIKRLNEILRSTVPRSTEIHEDGLGLRKVTGHGDFVLERVSKEKWVVRLNDETIELYNRKGRRVRGELNQDPDGDW